MNAPLVARRLLIRPGAIGDCIVSLPALEALRAPYTEVWVQRPNVPLIRFAERVRAIADTGLDWLEIAPHSAPASLIASLRSFDSIISWYGSNREQFRQVVSSLGLPFTFLPALPAEPGCHATDFYLEQARALGAQPRSHIPRIPCTPRPGRRDPYVVIHPFSGSQKKNWPLQQFEKLAGRLASSYAVEWTAGPEETLPGCRRFEDLYELACWIAGARLYIGNDSGISHLAAATGIPTIVLFGPTDPAVWAPRGPNVRVVRTPVPGAPIETLPLELVWQAVVALLEQL